MQICITGITGFVGQNLSNFLQKNGFSVEGLSLRTQWSYPKNADAIIHLAGKAHDTANASSPDEYFKVNRDLTKLLFDQFLQSETKDFFYFSSVKAVADTVEGVLTEEVIPHAVTPYGKSKLQAEDYLIQQKLPDGKRLFIIRPCMIHGPGNKGNLNLLYKVVEKGIPWPLGAFHNERSFLSIDNLIYLIEKILVNRTLPSGIYNFADDDSVSTNELVTVISKTLGKKERIWNIPTSVIKVLAKMGDVFHLPLNSERLKKLTENYIVSNQKIKAALGIKNLPLSAEEGLRKTIQSFKNK